MKNRRFTPSVFCFLNFFRKHLNRFPTTATIYMKTKEHGGAIWII